MHPAILLLTDSRLPAGGHAHSGGAEQAVAAGLVHDVPSLSSFLRGRLHTAGALAAALAAASCAFAAHRAARPPSRAEARPAGDTGHGEVPPHPETEHDPAGGDPSDASSGSLSWELLDAEADARTASPAQRKAARTQGRLLLRVARRLWPSSALDELAREVPSPHHPIALGAAAYAAGAAPGDAALAAAYHAVTGPATAAVRLLGLDPVAVHGLLAGLTPELSAIAGRAEPDRAGLTEPGGPGPGRTMVGASGGLRVRAEEGGWAALEASSAPGLDLLAEWHARAKVRLFVS